MAVVINQAIEVQVNKYEGEKSLKPLSSYFRMDSEGVVHKGRTVKHILDDMFSQFVQIPERGWQKFTASGDFTVPEKVTRVLVMCIAAGMSTVSSNLRGRSVFVSRYVGVEPGSIIPIVVGAPQAKGAAPGTKLQSSFNGTSLVADYNMQYWVDGQKFTYSNGQQPVFPADLNGKGMRTVAHLSGYVSTTGNAGPGAGGYAVPVDTPDERSAWLELARDMPAGTTNSGRNCYPDSSQRGTAASGVRAGNGANYGGCAGRYANGEGYSTYAGVGGYGLVCVFWGDDIFSQSKNGDPSLYRKDSSQEVTPFFVVADAANLAYNNSASGFTGNTVAEAIEELSSRISGS